MMVIKQFCFQGHLIMNLLFGIQINSPIFIAGYADELRKIRSTVKILDVIR